MKIEQKTTSINRQVLAAQVTKEHVLISAITLAETCGFQALTRKKVAIAGGVSEASVSKYFHTMNQMRRSVVRAAIMRGNLVVIAQALAIKDPTALKLSDEIKQKAAQTLT